MKPVLELKPSRRTSKKWQITTPMGKLVHFGAKGYQDYTEHQNPARKQAYILRHEATGKEQWDNLETAGAYSRWLLWEKPSLQEAINSMEKRFHIKITQ